MKRFISFALTLRGRLIMLVCLATMPAILFTFYIAYNERNATLKRTENEANYIVNLISREHLYQLASAKSLLGWLTDKLEKEENDTLFKDSDFLSALLSGYPQLVNIAILEPDGDVINSAYRLPGVINMQDYLAIKRASTSHDIETGVYVIGPIVKRPVLHLAKAVRDSQDNVKWIAFVAINLEWLSQLTKQVDLPSEYLLLIVDRDGRVLANSSQSDSNNYAIGTPVNELAEPNRRNKGIIHSTGGGMPRSFVTSPMKEIPEVFIATALPLEKIYKNANMVFYRMLGLLSLLTFGTLLLVVLVEEVSILRYLRALSGAAQRFGEGDYSARVAIPNAYGELKYLAKAFNAMAETLKRRHKELIEAHRRLDKLTRHLQVARESEAQHIARDLHDEVGQVLTSIKMDLSSFQQKCSHKSISPTVDKLIESNISIIRDKIDGIVDFIRQIASDLRPPVLDRMGIVSAMELLARNIEKNTELIIQVEAVDIEESFDWLVSITIYRIVQEALTNIVRHANATEVFINLQKTKNEISLVIKDNGKGIDNIAKKRESLGLIGMKERARLVGGTLDIESTPGKGTTIKVTISKSSNNGEPYEYSFS